MISKKLLCFSLPFFFFVLASHTVSGQSKNEGTAKIKINSNYENFYVLVGDSIKNAFLSNSGDFFDVQTRFTSTPSSRKLWVVPEFSNPFSIEEEFYSDSIHVLNISFQSILQKQSEIYLKLLGGDPSFKTLQNYRVPNSSLTYNFKMFSEEKYQAESNSTDLFSSTYVKVKTNADSLFIKTSSIDGRAKKIANGDSILVKPGYRSITISHQNSEEATIRRTFRKSATTTITHLFDFSETSIEQLSDNIATAPTYDANLIIVSDDDSEIYVNGRSIGMGAVKLNLRTGPANIRTANKKTGISYFSTKVSNVDDEKAIILNAYTKPSLRASRYFSVIPGASQMYKEQKLKGYSISFGFLISSYLTLQNHNNYKSELAIFEKLERRYNDETDEQRAFELGNQLDRQQQIVKESDNKRIAFFALTGAIYAFNVLDAFFNKPESGYRKKTDIDFYLNNEMVDNNRYTTLSLRYDF